MSVIRHLGILGAGNISDTHARAAASLPNLRVAAVCGVNAARVTAMAERHGATAYHDLDAFLRHTPLDIVAIGSPSGLHGDHVAAAAARGLHVLVEKPLEVTTERVDQMAAAVARAGVTLGVFFQDRCAPDLVALKADIEAGVLGRVTLADARVKWYRPPEYYSQSHWRGTWALDGGGALMNQGIHTADLLLWLLGDVSRVYAKAVTAQHAIEVEDTVVAVLEFASGAVGTLEATTAAWPGYGRRVALSGPKGTVVVEQDRIVRRDLRDAPAPLPASEGPASEGPAGAASAGQGSAGQGSAGQGSASQGSASQGSASQGSASQGSAAGVSAASPVVTDASAHRRVIEDFVAALDASRPARVSLEEGRRSVALVRAIYQSSREGRPVDIA